MKSFKANHLFYRLKVSSRLFAEWIPWIDIKEVAVKLEYKYKSHFTKQKS
jgi:hypothetical protein